MNRPRILQCLSQFSRTLEFQFLGVVKTYFHLMWMNSRIVSFGVVICFITSPIFVEVRKFKLNFHNHHRSQNVKSYLLQLLLEVKYLVGSYSDELGSCSYFKIATHGPIHKLLQINLSGNFLSVGGRPDTFLMDDPHAHG